MPENSSAPKVCAQRQPSLYFWHEPEIEGVDVDDGIDLVEQARMASDGGAEFSLSIPLDL